MHYKILIITSAFILTIANTSAAFATHDIGTTVRDFVVGVPGETRYQVEDIAAIVDSSGGVIERLQYCLEGNAVKCFGD